MASLRQGDSGAFEMLFKAYFDRLYRYAFVIVRDKQAAEELVQQVFFKIWETKKKLCISTSIQAYLYASVYHEGLRYIKREHRHRSYQSHLNLHSKNIHSDDPSARLEASELNDKIIMEINKLPEQCRTIFQLNRFEQLKYREIADELGISIKTVETQMGTALRRLRIGLKEFLPTNQSL